MGREQCLTEQDAGAASPREDGPPGDSETLSGLDCGPLRLVRKLGVGAVASVYLAEHPDSGTRFALKVLHPRLARTPAVLERFYAEGRALRQLVHPNVARVLDVRRLASGQHCLLMEYVEGTALSHLSLPVTPTETVFLLMQVLEGLEAAHAQGLIHRDLKPENLLLTQDGEGARRVRILDFGMAHTLAAGFSDQELAAGMVVGSRITVPAMVGAAVGALMTPSLRAWGWLGPNDPFRKVGFLVGLAMILGAAVVDLSLLAVQAVERVRNRASLPVNDEPEWKRVNVPRLLAWVVFWGVAVVGVATQLMHQPLGFILFGMALSLLFVLINGIAYGITDQNPLSSAFVVSVLLMSLLGLKNPVVGLLAASILLICTSVGCDMQQDRSTGWRLGTDRTLQFRYQVVGILMGSVLCVGMARVFMSAYPVLAINQLDDPTANVGQWGSAMTYKLVGAIRSLGTLSDHTVKALAFGLALGFTLEVARKLLKRQAAYVRFVNNSRTGYAVGWVMDSVVLASPYASSFGGFVNFSLSMWFGLGGILSSLWNTWTGRGAPQAAGSPSEGETLPEDMSTTSLVGGGLIAGESLYFLVVGLVGLAALMG